jgi:hypothetical protein
MKATVLAIALVMLAGCAELQQQSAQGGTSAGYGRQQNSGYPYNPHYY